MQTSERVYWIEHKGQKILFEDYSGLKGNEMLDVLYASEKVFRGLSSPVPVLLDFSGSFGNDQFLDELKRLGKHYDRLVLKGASVGITGLKKVLATAYNTFTGQGYKSRYFDNVADAKNFLAE